MGKSVFISRDLDDSSPFREMLAAAGLSVTGVSLVSIKRLPFSQVPSANWIFFYSKNGVDHFFGQLLPVQKERLPSLIATIGPGTAKALQKWEVNPTFIGNGDPLTTAEMFAEIALGQIVLFPQAESSRQSVQSQLDDDIQAIDLVVYANQKKPAPQQRNEDILVFTSPLNAEAYFQENNLKDDQNVVAIGAATAEKLRQCGIVNFFIAEKPTEEEMAKTVLSMLHR